MAKKTKRPARRKVQVKVSAGPENCCNPCPCCDYCDLYRPGTMVLMGDTHLIKFGRAHYIVATVKAISISESGVQYQVVWWDESTRHCQWVNASEINPYKCD